MNLVAQRNPLGPLDAIFEPPVDAELEVDFDTEKLSEHLGRWSEKAPRKKGGTISDGRIRAATAEVLDSMKSGDWADARSVHFVALYAHLHEGVYGAPPAELSPSVRLRASGMAARLLEKHFGGDRGEMAEFMRWTWTREKSREKWRRDNDRPGGRIGWRIQFNGALLDDYRVDIARTKGRK